MKYRDYIIYKSVYKGYEFHRVDYDGEKVRTALTIQDAKREIDELILGKIRWEVEMNERVYKWDYLSDAVKFASMFQGVLVNEIQSC